MDFPRYGVLKLVQQDVSLWMLQPTWQVLNIDFGECARQQHPRTLPRRILTLFARFSENAENVSLPAPYTGSNMPTWLYLELPRTHLANALGGPASI